MEKTSIFANFGARCMNLTDWGNHREFGFREPFCVTTMKVDIALFSCPK